MRSLLRVLATDAVKSAAADVPEKVGFIGLGQMGSRMAANLLHAGQSGLVVCDDRAEALHQAEKLGAEVASSPAALASTEGVGVIISMLPSTAEVRDAFLGSSGVVAADSGVRPSLLIDCSTIDPVASRNIAARLQAASLHRDSRPFPGCSAAHPAVIDAPVSGGVTGASAATLTFMVGGAAEAVKAAQPFLRAMGRHVLHCGGHGSGQAAKVANNLAFASQMAAVAEAMAFGISQGLDPALLARIFNTSSARCWASESYNPVPGVLEGVPASRDYKGGFSTAHMVKDLRLAVAASEAQGRLPLPMGCQALQLYAQVAEAHPEQDVGSIFRHVYGEGKASA